MIDEETIIDFALQIAGLPNENQKEFFDRAKEFLRDDEIRAIQVVVSVLQIHRCPSKYEALKNAVCDALCEQFFGKTVERRRTHDDPVLVSMFSNSIL